MKHISYIYYMCIAMACSLTGCSQEEGVQQMPEPDSNIMRFQVMHPSQEYDRNTRATETAFEADDRVGLFITEENEPLQLSGNYVNNALLTYNGTQWTPERTIYWNDGTYDIYAYYPRVSPLVSVDEAPFSVALDQSIAQAGSELGGFEASDFLWASAKHQKAGNAAVPLQFKHCMSKLAIRLVKGEDYEGDLPADAEVYVHNTVPTATIDVSAGIVTKDMYGKEATLKAKPEGNHSYAAIVVPQRISNRKPLLEVVMKGVSYLVESTFLFKPGIQHTVTIVISKNPEQVKIEIGGEIEDWEQE